MPVDKIIGFRVLAISLINLKSFISKDDILNNFILNFVNKFTARLLKGVLNNSIFSFLASLKAS